MTTNMHSYCKPTTPALPFELPSRFALLYGFEYEAKGNETEHVKISLMSGKELQSLCNTLFEN